MFSAIVRHFAKSFAVSPRRRNRPPARHMSVEHLESRTLLSVSALPDPGVLLGSSVSPVAQALIVSAADGTNTITGVQRAKQVDRNGDGYFQSLDLQVALNSVAAGTVYLKVWHDGPTSDRLLMKTPSFAVKSGVQTRAVSLSTDALKLPAGSYDLIVKAYDANGVLWDSCNASRDSDLKGVKLETSRLDGFPAFLDVAHSAAVDRNADSYRSSLQFIVTFQSPVPTGGCLELWQDNPGSTPDRLLLKTPNFTVPVGKQTQTLTIDPDAFNLPHGVYDFVLNIRGGGGTLWDSWDASRDSALNNVKLEKSTEDVYEWTVLA